MPNKTGNLVKIIFIFAEILFALAPRVFTNFNRLLVSLQVRIAFTNQRVIKPKHSTTTESAGRILKLRFFTFENILHTKIKKYQI